MIRHALIALIALATTLSACDSGDAPPSTTTPDTNDMRADLPDTTPTPTRRVRVATYNVSLHGASDGDLMRLLDDPDAAHPRAIAEVLQRVRPDIVLLNELDEVADGQAVARFQQNFLGRAQADGLEPLNYAHVYVPTVNTGVHSGHDLDKNGQVVSAPNSATYAGDAFGFGEYPGQYGMALLSKHPIDAAAARTFQQLLWQAMPDHLQPSDWYPDGAAAAMRLSSKTHADVPVRIGAVTLHALISHPTPPSFDGPEDRNGFRNHDEIRLWVDHLTPEAGARLRDDAGVMGGLAPEASFVVLGDLNSDPRDGDSRKGAILRLLEHPRVQDPQPRSAGGPEAAQTQGRANQSHQGDHALDTADFNDNTVGNLRVDYVLPSRDLSVTASGVFWPSAQEPGAQAITSSDHRLVWVDLALPAGD